MPGKQVKDWDQYHALRKQGHSKESAARITNASTKERKMPTQGPPPTYSPSENKRIRGQSKRINRELPEKMKRERVARSKDREAPEPQNLSPGALSRRRDAFQTKRGDRKTEDYGHTADPKAARLAAMGKLGAEVRGGRLNAAQGERARGKHERAYRNR